MVRARRWAADVREGLHRTSGDFEGFQARGVPDSIVFEVFSYTSGEFSLFLTRGACSGAVLCE